MPEEPPFGLYQSIHGILLCRDHALGLTIQQLADEEWARVPESQTGGTDVNAVSLTPLARHDSDPKGITLGPVFTQRPQGAPSVVAPEPGGTRYTEAKKR